MSKKSMNTIKNEILEIKPLNYQINDCVLNIFAGIINFIHNEYNLLFLNNWDFIIDNHDKLGTGTIDSMNWEKTVNDIQKYYQIQFVFKSRISFDNTISLIKKNISKKKAISFKINAKKCPWTPLWQKADAPHFILIIGIENNEVLYCVDSYYSDKIEKIYIKDIIKDCTEIIDYSYLKDLNCNVNYHGIIKKFIQANTNLGDILYNNISFFGRHIDIRILKSEKEKYREFEAIPFFRSIGSVENGRNNFSRLLSFISQKTKNELLQETANELCINSQKWNKIKHMFIKAIIMNYNEKYINQIKHEIFEIANFEKRIFYKLREKIYG